MYAQEESQQVALGGDTDRKSSDALKQLAKLAAARGAKVGVDLTWAWLDGKNPDFPDFKQMQVQRMCLYENLVWSLHPSKCMQIGADNTSTHRCYAWWSCLHRS